MRLSTIKKIIKDTSLHLQSSISWKVQEFLRLLEENYFEFIHDKKPRGKSQFIHFDKKPRGKSQFINLDPCYK